MAGVILWSSLPIRVISGARSSATIQRILPIGPSVAAAFRKLLKSTPRSDGHGGRCYNSICAFRISMYNIDATYILQSQYYLENLQFTLVYIWTTLISIIQIKSKLSRCVEDANVHMLGK